MKPVEKKKFTIPRQISKEIHVWRNVTIKEAIFLAIGLLIGYLLFRFLSPNINFQVKLFISLLPAAIIGLFLFHKPINVRKNIRLFHKLKWQIEFNRRQKVFTTEKTDQKRKQKTVQELIPIRSISENTIETNDNKLIKVLSISSVNLSLMSFSEQKEVYESYENFLKTIDAPIMISRVSKPLDLNDYIKDLQSKFKRLENPYKKRILKSYIWYANNIQEDRDMLRRSRYMVIEESFNSKKSKEEAIRKLKVRVDDYKLKIEEMLRSPKLEARELSNQELEKYFHMFFDYESALSRLR
jgi:hypothetical protein